jgi:hypothetical protein
MMALRGAFCTTHDESRPGQHNFASPQLPAATTSKRTATTTVHTNNAVATRSIVARPDRTVASKRRGQDAEPSTDRPAIERSGAPATATLRRSPGGGDGGVGTTWSLLEVAAKGRGRCPPRNVRRISTVIIRTGRDEFFPTFLLSES